MENDYFMNACWQAMEMNAITNQSQSQSQSQSPDCFYSNSNWDNSPLDQGAQQHFESALSSMVSSPAASNSNVSGDSHMIRELIGKLGKIGHSSAATSCYSTPLNSPPKMNLPVRDHLIKESFPKLTALNSTVAELSADPGFAERAARFSCFGSRSFNGRTAPYALNNNNNNANFNNNSISNNNNNNLELPYGSSPSMRLSRVSSSPSLKALSPQIRKNSEITISQEVSSVSEQNPGGEIAAKASNDLNSRKRKAVSKGKAKDSATIKGSSDTSEDPNAKRIKNGGDGTENDTLKAEDDEKKNKDDSKKPPEPPKDYIHVRARRGQATDSHSLAERVRREKISERMKLLQDLVPGCNKVIGKALMLDEIINYVQSLQRQVEFLSMKLATVNNTTMDFNVEALMSSKDMFQPNNNPKFESSAAVFHGQGAADGTLNHGSAVDPSCRGLDTHLPPPLNDLQYQNFYGGDLQTIVEMGFGQNSQQDSSFGIPSFPGSSSTASQMKTEL